MTEPANVSQSKYSVKHDHALTDPPAFFAEPSFLFFVQNQTDSQAPPSPIPGPILAVRCVS
jgi:hypothetical protein